jgi:di/tricarboxylate transporter
MRADILSLVIFIAVIILAFIRKNNVGILALAVGVIAVRLFGMADKTLIGGVSASMFVTLVGITLLFEIINQTGALSLLARKIVSLAGKRLWLIPIAIYIAGFVIAGVGPGAVPALAIIPALGVSVALQVGFDPVMLALIGECGLMAGRMTPITPEAAIITAAAESVGHGDAIYTVLVCQTLVTVVFSVVIWFAFKGHKVKAPIGEIAAAKTEKFNTKQIIALLSIVAMLVLIIFVSVNIGLAALFVAAVLAVFGVADDGLCLKKLPWGTICMVLGVGALLDVVNSVGGIDLLSNGISSIMTSATATPIMGISAGLLSLVSSALGVVYPTMMPMCADIAAQVGNVNPVALMAAVGAGGSLAGVSPMSTGGALILAALGTNIENFTKEDESKRFIQLFIYSFIGLIVIAVVSGLFYNVIANVMGA